MLTRKQYELLMYINERVREDGVPPSFDEMREALDLKSKSGIHRLITALVERGFIARLEHRARAIEILRMPENSTQNARLQGGFTPRVIEGGPQARDAKAATAAAMTAAAANMTIPLLGKIAAGTPIEALQNNLNDVSVPPEMVTGGEHYALLVTGDSMKNAGILDGDTVIIRRTDSAQSGDIVVALVDDQEATLKRLRRKGGSVALEAANPDYETRIYAPERVKVQGRLVGLLRHY